MSNFVFSMLRLPPTYLGVLACLFSLSLVFSLPANAVDNGSQMNEKFRINYAGYLPQASKTALYLTANQGPISWSVVGSSCSGSEDTYVVNDKSSGDSFYIIDFSVCTDIGSNLRLQVGSDQSLPFDISDDPYGNIKYEFFDYFQDHEASATFQNAKNNWQTGLSISFPYVRDAGDNGAYPTNTAEASWALINILETYPSINTYYSSRFSGAKTVYNQLTVLTEQFNHVLSHNAKLAIPKFHTNVNGSWASCSPHSSGTCISEPETKATFATARTLAAMARLHLQYATSALANTAYNRAKTAMTNAQSEALRCNQANAFGGEGGMYPDNDTYSLYRNPKTDRDNCYADKNNTEDDEYTALVELYIAAEKLGLSADASSYKSQVSNHPRFNEASSFWWGAVAMEGGLSLLANETTHTIDLSLLKANILSKATQILANQELGYPGVTWDANSSQWNNGDQDNVDNNVRWGSHRMALNDARILMAAAEISKDTAQNVNAATYARGAIKVLDHMSGINAVNLTMYTAAGYPQFENAITRTHDGANGGDSWAGKLVLGPNNWTNADDGAMPAFGSKPGLKMFALTGAGWASREVSIDANASLVPVAYFTTEIAPAILNLDPIGGGPSLPTNVPAAPTQFSALAVSASAVKLSWQDNSGANSDAETGFAIFQNTTNVKPSMAIFTSAANSNSWTASGLDAQTTYYFWLEAVNALGSSAPSSASATTPEASAASNIISNGDFILGTDGWTCAAPGGTASCSVINGEYSVGITSGGSSAWHIQPMQGNISLVAGRTYTLAFDARAAQNRSAEIKIERAVSPWEDFTNIGSGQALTSVMQRFRYTFSMPASLSNARLVMNIGGSSVDVTVDNIWLVEGADDPCTAVGCGTSPAVQYDIVVSTGANGSITPGSVSVNEGGNQSFNIVADAGYRISEVYKNGISLGAVSTVTFNNVQANQSLSASFEQDNASTYTLTVNAGANGSISPSTQVVSAGASQSFSISADSGFVIDDVMVNGNSVGAVSTYTFSNVSADAVLSASFKASSSGGSFICNASNSTAVSGGSQQSVSQGDCLSYQHGSGSLRIGSWSASGTESYDIQNCNGGLTTNVAQLQNGFSTVTTGANNCIHYIYVKSAASAYTLQLGSW